MNSTWCFKKCTQIFPSNGKVEQELSVAEAENRGNHLRAARHRQGHRLAEEVADRRADGG